MEGLWVTTRGQTNTTNTVVGVCDRAPDQEEVVDEVFCRQLEEASRSQTLVFTEEFNLPNICWRSSTAGHKQSRFGECIDDKFLMKVIKEPTTRGWLLDLTLTNMEELVRDVKVRVTAVAMRRRSSGS